MDLCSADARLKSEKYYLIDLTSSRLGVSALLQDDRYGESLRPSVVTYPVV